jgi:hypothetical protein
MIYLQSGCAPSINQRKPASSAPSAFHEHHGPTTIPSRQQTKQLALETNSSRDAIAKASFAMENGAAADKIMALLLSPFHVEMDDASTLQNLYKKGIEGACKHFVDNPDEG